MLPIAAAIAILLALLPPVTAGRRTTTIVCWCADTRKHPARHRQLIKTGTVC